MQLPGHVLPDAHWSSSPALPGAGKSTRRARGAWQLAPLPLLLSVSATTRPPRPGEVDGNDYYFLTPEEFAARREAGRIPGMQGFSPGNWYGTLQSEVTAGLEEGKWVVLEIDVEGTLAVLEQHPDALTIFVHRGSHRRTGATSPGPRHRERRGAPRRLAHCPPRTGSKAPLPLRSHQPRRAQAVREVCEILLPRSPTNSQYARNQAPQESP